MGRNRFDRKKVFLDHPYKRKRRKAFVIVLIVLSVALLAAIAFRTVNMRRLRADMEGYLADAAGHIDRGRFEAARSEASDALSLAQRLRDDVYIDEIIGRIRLIEAVIRADGYFDDGSYQAARNTYLLAAEYASIAGRLGADYIDEMIAATESYISIYTIIGQADELLSQDDFESAMALYQKAVKAAAALSFDEGKELAAAGIEETEERIVAAKYALAEELLLLGDQSITIGDYSESIDHYQSALIIFEELNDPAAVASTEARIEVARRRIADKEQQEQQGPKDDTDKGTEGEGEIQQGGEDPDQKDGPMDPDTNYAFNLGLSFDLSALIDDQNKSPANQVRMGTAENRNEGWYNGCGWIAAYNALILLGNPKHPAEIVRDFETSGTVMGGVYGTYPNAIVRYLSDCGHSAEHVLFPQVSVNIDNVIKAAGIAILGYAHTKAAHYVTIEYRARDDAFVVYNDGFARSRSTLLGLADNNSGAGAVIDSVLAFIQETPEILFSFSLITIA